MVANKDWILVEFEVKDMGMLFGLKWPLQTPKIKENTNRYSYHGKLKQISVTWVYLLLILLLTLNLFCAWCKVFVLQCYTDKFKWLWL